MIPLRRFDVRDGVSLRRTYEGVFSIAINCTPAVHLLTFAAHLLNGDVFISIYVPFMYTALGLLIKFVFMQVSCTPALRGDVQGGVQVFVVAEDLKGVDFLPYQNCTPPHPFFDYKTLICETARTTLLAPRF